MARTGRPSTADDRETGSETPTGERRLSRRATIRGLLTSLAAPLVAGTAAGAQSTDTDCETTAEETLGIKETAQRRDDELRRLAEEDGVRISESVLESVAYHVDQGNLLLQTEQYCEAAEHYRTAIDQAEAALTRGYTQHARLLLDASAVHLRKLEERGYVSFRTTKLDERVAAQRTRLESVEGLEAARDAREDARALADEVAALPEPSLVDRVRFLDSGKGILAGAALLTVVGYTGFLTGRVRSPTVEERDRDDEDLV